ncbi:hypothetical protein ACJMK2_025520 [Sinanodonta woodiana]|uniref:Chitin-binding type-4 domain-containing protein n=1 Tax=Sinanodonta woodiana TaxID=1069815 RepID=A0ABD3XGS3_SINWO
MVSSMLTFLSLICIQDASGHGALIEPPMRSVLWKYGFDAPINYNYMELYCGGFKNFQDNGGRCGVCGDALLGPYNNERGGKYDLGIIARSYPLGTTSIEVKVEISAYHKGYFEFKLCPNDEAEVTQECLNRYTLMIEEGLQQGDPTKFYPPDGQTIHSLKVSIPPDIRCERCVLQWTYRAGNTWGTNPDGKSCLGCGMQETFVNCADISFRSDGSSRFQSIGHKDRVVKTSIQKQNGTAPNNKEHGVREIGTRRQLSNNIMPKPLESQWPMEINDTHPDRNTNQMKSHLEQKQEIDSELSVNHILSIGILHHEKVVSPSSDKAHEDSTSHFSFQWHNKAMPNSRGQESNHQLNDIEHNELYDFLAKLPRENKVMSTTSRKDERQPATVFEALHDTLKHFNATDAALLNQNIHYDPRFSHSIDSQLPSRGWSDPRSLVLPMQSQWTSGNSIIHSRVPLIETVNQLPHNNASMPQLRFHSAAPHDDMVVHSSESVSQAHIQSLPEHRITSRARQSLIPSNSQLQSPFQNTAQWINPIQIPAHQQHSLFGQQHLPRFSPSNVNLFPVNEILLPNVIHTQLLDTRPPHGIITGMSTDVQARVSLISSQAQEFYQRLAHVASLHNAHQLSQNFQHASQMPIERARANNVAIQNLHSAIPSMIHREALIRNPILSDRQSIINRRFSHGV